MIRKITLQIGVPTILALMAWNAILAIKHLIRMQKSAALALESSALQADLSSVLKDVTDMETGQRGYLLTADPAYLQPYAEAKARIGTDLAGLRTGLVNGAHREHSLYS